MDKFLLLLLIFFVVIPLVKIMVAIYRARQQTRRFFDSIRNAASGRQSGDASAKTAAPHRPAAKKKIDPSVGEYVAFEEIKVDTTQASGDTGRRYTEVEQQVVDAEWEDIKQ